jgi:hypothetical protein
MQEYSDDELDALLRHEAPAYRTPPTPPLDAMWATIEQAHFGAPVHAVPLRVHRVRSTAARWRLGAGIAASVLIGVGIGRVTAPRTYVTGGGVAPAVIASAPAPVAAERVSPDVDVTANPDGRRAPSVAARVTPVGQQRSVDAIVEALAAPLAAPILASAGGNAYEATTSRYLGQTAALLVALPGELRAGRADQRFVSQAGDLLSTTRLLLDSHAAANADVRRLLEDLELVLAQIARLPARRGAEELDLITQTLEDRDVVPRLRSAAAEISAQDD